MHQGHQAVPTSTDRVARAILDAALTVHKTLGPGLLESVYEHCLAYELSARNVPFVRQQGLPVAYGPILLEGGYRTDLIVAGCVIVEIKAVDALAPLHTAQLLTYLKLSELRLGLLINFNVPLLKDGIRRLVL